LVDSAFFLEPFESLAVSFFLNIDLGPVIVVVASF